jgi:hypothetical protein
LSGVFSLARSGHWFLHSGIQSAIGGVARFYRADLKKNRPVSTEITGYTASALIFLYSATKDDRYLERARLTAHFLCEHAWDAGLGTFPFEHPSPSADTAHQSYFFDCGIIVRGLLAVWRVTREQRLLDVAVAAAHGMLQDFHTGTDFHPILELPERRPLERIDHWSRTPGCYQLKSALAWWEIAKVTGDETLRAAYLELLESSLGSYRNFLPGTSERVRIMDRLHPACYFLESLYPVLDRPDCVEAYRYFLGEIGRYLREIAPEFCRSDVYAQLLRARIYGAGVVPLDEVAAQEEASALVEFQVASEDTRLDGGFFFGRRNGEMVPHANPVSTAFGMQALWVWQNRNDSPCQLPPL